MTKKKSNNVDSEYWEVVELTDPTTGKKFKQNVKITKYKTPSIKEKGILEELEDVTPIILPEDTDQE